MITMHNGRFEMRKNTLRSLAFALAGLSLLLSTVISAQEPPQHQLDRVSLGAGSTFAAAEGVISNTVLTEGSYCHLKFPAIREETLSWDRPVLKDPSEGDIIDHYGSCDHHPLGKDEIASQRPQLRRKQIREGE